MRLSLWVALTCIILLNQISSAQEFRVETDVFVENGSEPIASNLTLFVNGPVYDLVLSGADKLPIEITVFDPARQRILLVHVEKEIRAEVTTDELFQFVAGMRARDVKDKDLAFFMDPQLEPTFDVDTQELLLKSRRLTYRVKGKPPEGDKITVQRYREFADIYARLNWMMRPGHLPPQARMELNKEIADRNWIPQEIHRTIVVREGLIEKKLQASTRHMVNWKLSNTDRRHIENTSAHIANFEKVTWPEYARRIQPAVEAKRR